MLLSVMTAMLLLFSWLNSTGDCATVIAVSDGRLLINAAKTAASHEAGF